MEYIVLLYYKFVPIPQASIVWKEHQKLCKRLELTGRVLIGEEGINGTVAGTSENIEEYKQSVWAHPLFADLAFKESKAAENPFPKLKVKLRPEIISLYQSGIAERDPGKYISPQELNTLYESGEEFYVLDARNNYESLEGAFKDAITPDIANFRDLPAMVEQLGELKDKKVVTYCTGGIRCEKATAFMKEQGFKDVYQLEGGIVNYILQYPNTYFEGDCYVFDNRMRLNQEELSKHGSISQAPQSLGQSPLVQQ